MGRIGHPEHPDDPDIPYGACRYTGMLKSAPTTRFEASNNRTKKCGRYFKSLDQFFPQMDNTQQKKSLKNTVQLIL